MTLIGIILKLLGWNTSVEYPYHHIKKHIILVGPHTSNWDFVIAVAYRSLLKLHSARFLGKAELFVLPFGFLFRWLGGTPVDRKASHNVVDQIADIFIRSDSFILALSPEGTRKKVDKLRTGFYFIARKANVPIVMVGLDYKNKRVLISEPLFTTNDQKHDFETIVKFFQAIQGKVPENGIGVIKLLS